MTPGLKTHFVTAGDRDLFSGLVVLDFLAARSLIFDFKIQGRLILNHGGAGSGGLHSSRLLLRGSNFWLGANLAPMVRATGATVAASAFWLGPAIPRYKASKSLKRKAVLAQEFLGAIFVGNCWTAADVLEFGSLLYPPPLVCASDCGTAADGLDFGSVLLSLRWHLFWFAAFGSGG